MLNIGIEDIVIDPIVTHVTCAVEQTTGLDRNPIDKYYTKTGVARECVALMRKHVSPRHLNKDIVIEPSAGSGSFISSLKTLKCQLKMYDILPDHIDVMKRDYLSIPLDELRSGIGGESGGRIHVVGNPPFGRQASLAIKFIKRSCEFADSISFILPKSFKKDSMRRAFSPNYHMYHQHDLDPSSFLVNDKEYDSPCIFQIWVRQTNQRTVPVVHVPTYFSFVKRPDLVTGPNQTDNTPHVAVRRVGVYAGRVTRTPTAADAETKSVHSHYFIRFTPKFCEDNDIDVITTRLNEIVYEPDNTVGPRSVSKNELVGAFNLCLEK